MNSETTEHFCTLFDSNFLPQGIALHASLTRQHSKFHLWVICMDDKTVEHLRCFDLPNLTSIPVVEIETPALKQAKKSRSRGEYCWTLSSFTFQAVFDRCPTAKRATYVDADLYFFDNPQILFSELEVSGKQVLYTDHAYAPKYDQSKRSGRYCVQFLCISNTPGGHKVMSWWQEKCLEWCYNRVEPDRFGDQKYLDKWATLFPSETHVVTQFDKTLAPWNVKHSFLKTASFYYPVFFHFHSLRIVTPVKVRLYTNYLIGTTAKRLYDEYLLEIRRALDMMNKMNFPTPCLPHIKRRIPLLSMIKKVYIQGNEKYQKF